MVALKDMEIASINPQLNEFLECKSFARPAAFRHSFYVFFVLARREVLKASTNKKQAEKSLVADKSVVDDEILV